MPPPQQENLRFMRRFCQVFQLKSVKENCERSKQNWGFFTWKILNFSPLVISLWYVPVNIYFCGRVMMRRRNVFKFYFYFGAVNESSKNTNTLNLVYLYVLWLTAQPTNNSHDAFCASWEKLTFHEPRSRIRKPSWSRLKKLYFDVILSNWKQKTFLQWFISQEIFSWFY